MYSPNVGSFYPIYAYKKCMLPNPAPKGRTLNLPCIISNESYSQTFGNFYPIQIYISKCTFPNPASKGFTDTLQLTYIYPNCWQDISNIYFVISIFVFRFEEYSCIYILVLDISYQQLGEICQLEGLCAPWNVHFVIYIVVLDICCQHLGNIQQLDGFCAPFGRKVKECTFCNIYIYIYICIGYMLPKF